jgi:hypothetical protein
LDDFAFVATATRPTCIDVGIYFLLNVNNVDTFIRDNLTELGACMIMMIMYIHSCKLEQVGTSWNQLEPVGTSWNTWFTLASGS